MSSQPVRDLERWSALFDNTLLRKLNENNDHKNPRQSRAVDTGHYVKTLFKPLPNPYFIAASRAMMDDLGLDPEEASTAEFLQVFSGNKLLPVMESWSTAYGVSVYGWWATNSPFGPCGYGDGRAMSMGEVLVPETGKRWELQIKGAGPTPFARTHDGRAVLRSSVREFLVSEAMHHLGVPTTRALSLVATNEEHVDRAWYPTATNEPMQVPDNFPYKPPPNTLSEERCAMVCRVCSSFLRVGHVELFVRHRSDKEFEQFLEYVLEREFDIDPSLPLTDRVVLMFAEVCRRQARLVCQWLRVGYVQGNMNSDNCLLNGCTMDYGPFGFMEVYNSMYQPFTSDPEGKYAFTQQPRAAQMNMKTLASSLAGWEPMVSKVPELSNILNDTFSDTFLDCLNGNIVAQFGLSEYSEDLKDIRLEFLKVIEDTADYIIAHRRLADVPIDGTEMEQVAALSPAFTCEKLAGSDEVRTWLQKYTKLVKEDGINLKKRVQTMKAASPKYIPRNWMLVLAYEAAERGDFSVIHEMQKVFERPYDEQPEMEKYFRITPDWARNTAGVAFMS